ncbi:hypothetical protein ACS0TY_010713 [Phlomoides rotata]
MAPKKLVFADDGEDALDKADEDGTAAVSPKKMKVSEPVGSEPGENGSACSSPSASGFIVMPTAKPSGKKKNKSKIFSDEDEIALLQGLAVFWANGKNNKWTQFHHFINTDLTNQFSKTQISEKVRKLKIKFETNFEKARANGGRLDFSDSHGANVFRLCKALWGDDEEANKIQRKRKGGAADDDDDGGVNRILEQEKQGDEHHQEENTNSAEKGKQQQVEDFQSAFPLLYASFDTFKHADIIKEKCILIPRDKAQEVEDKCRELEAEALRLELKKIDLIKRDLQHHLQKN